MAVIGSQQLIITIILGVLTILLFGLNMLTRGFFLPFLWVKVSKGKRVLVDVHTRTGSYFKSGRIEDGFLVYSTRTRERKWLVLPELKDVKHKIENTDVQHRAYGVDVFHVDEEKNGLLTKDFAALEGYDPVKFDNLFVRIATRPSVNDKKMLLLLIGVGLCILLIGFVAFRVIKLEELIIAQQSVQPITGVI